MGEHASIRDEAATPTAADLRAEIARRRLKLYDLAPRVGIHPTNLGAILGERRVLTPQLANRITRALNQEAAGR